MAEVLLCAIAERHRHLYRKPDRALADGVARQVERWTEGGVQVPLRTSPVRVLTYGNVSVEVSRIWIM